MVHPHANLVREGFAAYGRGDLDALQRHYFAKDIQFHLPGRSPLAGDHKGIAQVLPWLGRFYELSGGTIRLEMHDVVADERHAVALFRVRAERAGRRLDDASVDVFHIHDGKATEAWTYPADLYAWDEFWS